MLNNLLLRRKLSKMRNLIDSSDDLVLLDELINSPLEEKETIKERNIKILNILESLKEEVVLNKVHASNINKATSELFLFIQNIKESIL